MEINFEAFQLPLQADGIAAIEGGYLLTGAQVAILHPFGFTRFFRHGFHSWSLTTWLDLKHPLPAPSQTGIWPQIDDPALLHEYPFSGSIVGALEGFDSQILLLGALGLDAIVRGDDLVLRGQYEGSGGAAEWFLAYGPEETIFARYAELLGERLGRCGQQKAPRVWCSWYSLWTDIHQDSLAHILSTVRDLPFDVFQIDDGWQLSMGDWDANPKFSHGMQSLAEKITEAGFTAGIWLAPFIVQPKSRLFNEHRGWLLYTGGPEQGNLVQAGHNWGSPFYALDTTHPEVQDWLHKTIRKIRGWGFDYLKIDFLYASALKGARYNDVPRQEAYRQGLEVISQAAGDAYILACGAPVMASLGLVDGIRVGPDVAPYWDNAERSVALHDYSGPSTLNALRTSLNRLWLRPLVHIDPDVAFFRARYNLLLPHQRDYLRDLAWITDFRATSDLPDWLDMTERGELISFLEAEPSVEKLGRYRYRIDGREVNYQFIEKLE